MEEIITKPKYYFILIKTTIMKRKFSSRVIALFAALFIVLSVNAQNDTITPIKKIDVDKHLDSYCVIEGLVTQYTPATSTSTANYIALGAYGTPITVNTSGKKPIINRKYRIKGIIKADLFTDQAYIVEVSKSMIIPPWIFIVVGGILLVILAIVLILVLGGKSYDKKPVKSAEPTYDESLKTVRIVKDVDDPTLIFIPGKLKILNGDDKDTKLVLAGFPTTEGGVLTIGSRDESGVKKLTHIRLMEKTVSKQQAEIIYHKNDKKVFIKNLSKVNYTKLNGDDIYVDEAKEIKTGDTLKMGELEFQYI